MDHSDNPAGRLRATLTACRDRDGARQTQAVWAEVRAVADEPGPVALEITKAMELARTVRARIGQHSLGTAALSGFEQVDAALVATLHGLRSPISKTLAPLGQLGLQSLQMCDEILHVYYPDTNYLKTHETARFIHIFRTIRSEVTESDLSSELQELLKSRIDDLIAALTDSQFTGFGSAQRANDALFGALARSGALQQIGKNPVLKGILALVAALDLALNIGANVSTLAGADDPPVITILNEYVDNNIRIDIDAELSGREANRAVEGPAGSARGLLDGLPAEANDLDKEKSKGGGQTSSG